MGDVSNAVLLLCAKGKKREEVSGNNKVISYINFMRVKNSSQALTCFHLQIKTAIKALTSPVRCHDSKFSWDNCSKQQTQNLEPWQQW